MTSTTTLVPSTERAMDQIVPSADIFAFPVSSGQQRIWFLEQLQPDSALYNVPIALRLEGRLDPSTLERALNLIVRRHEALRTCFAIQKGEPVQIVAPALTLDLPVVELESVSQGRRAAEARRLAVEEARRPFDLKRPPLVRTRLLRLADTEHIFLLTAHHIVFDGWSLMVFLRELAALYERLHADDAADLPELPIQYADFAVWQRERIESLDKELDWWKKHLGGKLPVLELPTDRARPAAQTYRGAVESVTLPAGLRDALLELSRREGVTLFMTLLAAFQTLLHRYTGQEDILIGSPVAGRHLRETEEVIGLFINTLLMRGNLSGDPTFRELLGRTRKQAVEAYANDDVPFEKLVEALQPDRSLSHSPLFQVMFALERAPAESVNWPGLKLTQIELDSGTAKFDLTLYAVESAGGLAARMEYNTDLFDVCTIQRMLAHFRSLLEGIVAAPDKRLSDLPLLTEAERHRVLIEWNETRSPYPADKTIHQLVEEQVERAPDAIAAVFEDQSLTYRELNERAEALAVELHALGAGPDARVALCLNRSLDMLVGLLGILKSGAGYVPLDPTHPKERIAFMLKDSRATVLLTQESLRGHFKFEIPNLRMACVDALPGPAKPKPAFQNPESEKPAYLIYTSGSTGKPKGVVIPHRAVVNFLISMAREPGLTAGDTLVAVTTLSFDIAVLELLLPLTVGARVVIASYDETVDGQALHSLLERYQASVMQATPVTWRMLLDAGWTPRSGFKALVGGESLPRELADRLLERGVELWNMYGPTETTVWSTCARITDTANGITIGKPIANTTVRILDKSKNLCPIGVPGELCIGGDGVALNYWNRPELSADRFIPDLYSTIRGARLYRTGDLARWRDDGTLEHLGRLDFQVKLRGFRIELGEIEAAIAQHPVVREVAVIAREENSVDKRLVAYIVGENAPANLMDELRTRLRVAIPEYMVPSQFVMLEALPRTFNGKLDRKALPTPSDGDGSPHKVAVAPKTPTEEMVLGVFRSVLDRDDVGVSDNFFDLGGHSLMAARLMARLRSESGVDLPLRDLFARPTVAGLAEAIDALQWLQKSKTPANGLREEFVL